jgi:sulfite reductase alpha subunit-like flavoprotein
MPFGKFGLGGAMDKGGKSESETNEYDEKLKSDKRYKRDVY